MDANEVKLLNSKPLDDHSHDEEIEALILIHKGMAEE